MVQHLTPTLIYAHVFVFAGAADERNAVVNDDKKPARKKTGKRHTNVNQESGKNEQETH